MKDKKKSVEIEGEEVKKETSFPKPNKNANVMNLFVNDQNSFEGKFYFKYLGYLREKIKSVVKQEIVSQFTTFKFGISELIQENSSQVYNDLSKMALDVSELSNRVGGENMNDKEMNQKV